jgi:hypothetical protein
VCGRDVIQPPSRGRRRVWCSAACRRWAHKYARGVPLEELRRRRREVERVAEEFNAACLA